VILPKGRGGVVHFLLNSVVNKWALIKGGRNEDFLGETRILWDGRHRPGKKGELDQ